LSAIRIRLKERRAELDREFNRLHMERAAFEAARGQLDEACGTAVAVHPNADAPPATAAGADLSADPVGTSNEADEHAEIASSVADYMEQLLGRMRNRRNGGVLIEERGIYASAHHSTVAGGGASHSTDQGMGNEGSRRARLRAPRRPHNAEEAQAAVGTLRQIANHSARRAVAKHSSRRLRRSIALTFLLAIIAFPCSGVLFTMAAREPQYASQGIGVMMLGTIATIMLLHSLWKMSRCEWKLAALAAGDLETAISRRQNPESGALSETRS
jgi:hypothetical protein